MKSNGKLFSMIHQFSLLNMSWFGIVFKASFLLASILKHSVCCNCQYTTWHKCVFPSFNLILSCKVTWQNRPQLDSFLVRQFIFWGEGASLSRPYSWMPPRDRHCNSAHTHLQRASHGPTRVGPRNHALQHTRSWLGSVLKAREVKTKLELTK